MFFFIVAGERHFIKWKSTRFQTQLKVEQRLSLSLSLWFGFCEEFESMTKIDFFSDSNKPATQKIRDLEMAGTEVKCSF